MDWGDIERLINAERMRGNPVADIIVKCHFDKGKMVLALREMEEEQEENGDETDEEEEDVPEGKVVEVEVDLGLSAWANARQYFDLKKVAAEKVHQSPGGLVGEKRLNSGIAYCTIVVQGP